MYSSEAFFMRLSSAGVVEINADFRGKDRRFQRLVRLVSVMT